MEMKTTNNNSIIKKETNNGTLYIANLGTVIYNNRLIHINNLIIPISGNRFFSLPQDKNKYAVVNVYYQLKPVQFIFDNIGVYDKYVSKVSSDVKVNLIPIAQFVLRQESKSYVVDHVNEISQMSTFSISDSLSKGITGPVSLLGLTGPQGTTGPKGSTGSEGCQGITGVQGITGSGIIGSSGPKGTTGYYPDLSLQLYYKFKSDSIKVTDYSIYERDSYWGISGGNSYFIKQEGVVDSAHKNVYGGGYSAYKRNMFLPFGESGAVYYPFGIGANVTGTQGFTGGTISAWVKINQAPIPDFTVEVDSAATFSYRLKDSSLFFPDRWEWDFGDGTTSTAFNPIHEFPAPGDYIVKMTAFNSSGNNYVYKLVTIPSP